MNGLMRNSMVKFGVSGISLAVLLWLSFAVLQEFFLVIAWAVIIAYVMWPLYFRLKLKLNQHTTLSATVMTGLISAVVTLALYGLVNSLQKEVVTVYQELITYLASPPKQLPESFQKFPWLSEVLQPYLDQLNGDQAGIKTQLLDWAKQGLGQFAKFLGSLGRNIISLVFILVTLFFCFRDGQQIIGQLKRVLSLYLGENHNTYLNAAGDTAKAVVYGLVLAALGQGVIAGVGYSVAGVNAPALLGAITALFAMVPMGAPLVWLPVSLGLFVAGSLWQGIGLLLWGVFAISTVDNIIRPLVISGAGRIPFLVVLFGVFGGLKAFGFAGLFLGPIILSVLLAVWRAWLAQQEFLSRLSDE